MKQLFAIVDIETTGGYAYHNKITEIAICIYDGVSIVERFESLVNPQQPIPYSIQQLTGITNEMVAKSPVFEQIAEKIYHLLHRKVFVAHNVNFDYSFVRNELSNAGFLWKANKLCTVRLSRTILPHHRSYSLGNLCRDLKINLHNRHRAMGDCEATAVLFDLLMKTDSNEVLKHIKTIQSLQKFPPNISTKNYDELPEKIGIYKFINQKGKLIYVGKAINIKKRVAQHFSSQLESKRKQDFLNEIYCIEFEETANEFMALLREYELIQHHWPKFNTSLKQYEPKYAIALYKDGYGYQRLAVTKVIKGHTYFRLFSSLQQAHEVLKQTIDEYELNINLCHFYNEELDVRTLKSKAVQELTTDLNIYNSKVSNAILNLQNTSEDLLVFIDNGRNENEQSFVLFDNQRVIAKGYIEKNRSANDIYDAITDTMKCNSSFYTEQLFLKYALLYPEKIIQVKKEL